ncbi:hypothetical protein BVRB_6g155340 [Beta vulgaris subsp. vulgaris]|uniref:Uncharacterized protein n=1 Tax=Beta vulgaris subsp. vulgaris TaxID=3555 RepID=A0A0J8BBL9_BETVV|nr:hypothetical protein BVRB_6g155340 [Beta vulgaris subsp. vulgaris]
MTGSAPKIILLGKGPQQPWMVFDEEEVLREMVMPTAI